MILWLLLQLGLTAADGGTPHIVELTWPGITLMQSNDDGSTFTRPPLGYWVYRAKVEKGMQGPWVLLNGDAAVVGMAEDDGTLDPCIYRDDTVQQGSSYVYAVTAVDFAGETPQSNLSAAGPLPINPNTPGNLQANVQ